MESKNEYQHGGTAKRILLSALTATLLCDPGCNFFSYSPGEYEESRAVEKSEIRVADGGLEKTPYIF
jgi:hypothetical protein